MKLKKALFLLTAIAITVSGCTKEETPIEKTVDSSTTVTLEDTDILIGATLLSDLQAKGYTVAKDKNLKEPIPDDEMMPARTYDVGIYFGKEELVYGHIEALNDKTEEIPYTDSIINSITVYYDESTDPYSLPYYHEKVIIDGEDFKGLTAEEVLEKIGDSSDEKPSTTPYPDGSYAYISFSRKNCYFKFNFNMEKHTVQQVEIEMFHSNF